MMREDIYAPDFPHGTPDGYRGGCRGAAECANHRSTTAPTCAMAHMLLSSDWSYGRLWRAGDREGAAARAKNILAMQPADEARDSAGARAARNRGVPTRAFSPAQEQAAAATSTPTPRDVVQLPAPRAPHGTPAGYSAGCRTDCPASPSCTDAIATASDRVRAAQKDRGAQLAPASFVTAEEERYRVDQLAADLDTANLRADRAETRERALRDQLRKSRDEHDGARHTAATTADTTAVTAAEEALAAARADLRTLTTRLAERDDEITSLRMAVSLEQAARGKVKQALAAALERETQATAATSLPVPVPPVLDSPGCRQLAFRLYEYAGTLDAADTAAGSAR